MAWADRSELPLELKALSVAQANLWQRVYDRVLEIGESEATARRMAWAVVRAETGRG